MAEGSLNKNLGEPRYMALARRLADDIRKGKYPINSLIPTEAELTSKYSISRFTVREAIRQLQSQGLVIRRQGVGTRVLADYPVRNYMQTRNTVEEVLQYGVQSLLKEMEMSEIKADAILAERLGCPYGEAFLKIAGLRMPVDDPNGLPVCWTEIFVLTEVRRHSRPGRARERLDREFDRGAIRPAGDGDTSGHYRRDVAERYRRKARPAIRKPWIACPAMV